MNALSLRNLRVDLGGRRVVDGVDLAVAPGECVAIVGESGAGKSLTARALLGLNPAGALVRVDELTVDGVDARTLDDRGWRALRGTRIALVAQDALVSLDPLRRIGAEVAEHPVQLALLQRVQARRRHAHVLAREVAERRGGRRLRHAVPLGRIGSGNARRGQQGQRAGQQQ